MYFDLSLMGTGKTFIAIAVCIKYNLPLFVVCPVSSTFMWSRVAELYNIKLIDVKSFGILRGQGSHRKLNHPYLVKELKSDTSSTFTYSATPLFQKLCDDGMLMVIDEGQNIKNNGLQTRSVQALCDAIRSTSKSRFAILSASLFDKQQMAINLLRTIGFYGNKSERLYFYNIGSRMHDYTGYKEIIANCEIIDVTTTHDLLLPYLPEGGNASKEGSTLKMIQNNVYRLFTNVVLERCSSSMPDPLLPSNMMNGFYMIHNSSMRKLAEQSKNAIQRATGYSVSTETIQWQKKSLDVITASLASYEISLLEICVRETLRWVDIHKGGKVIIFTNYTKPLKILYGELKHLGAEIFYGKLKPHEREQVEKRFQTDPKCRVFIGNMQAGGLGLNLQDLSPGGTQPRLVVILPTYKVMDMYQATGRAVRRGMTSEATVRIIYSKEFPLDCVFDAIAKKSNVLMDINNRSHGAKRTYPGGFKKYIEDDGVEKNSKIREWNERHRVKAFQEAIVTKFEELDEDDIIEQGEDDSDDE